MIYFKAVRLKIQNFSSSAGLLLKKTQYPPRPKINEAEITEVFLKGGGKGGQKINKTNSKVQLKHIPTGIVVESQFSRSREDNRKRARNILALKLDEIYNKENSRAAILAKIAIKKARKKKQLGRKHQRERMDELKQSKIDPQLITDTAETRSSTPKE